jgi:hypothetical protein
MSSLLVTSSGPASCFLHKGRTICQNCFTGDFDDLLYMQAASLSPVDAPEASSPLSTSRYTDFLAFSVSNVKALINRYCTFQKATFRSVSKSHAFWVLRHKFDVAVAKRDLCCCVASTSAELGLAFHHQRQTLNQVVQKLWS